MILAVFQRREASETAMYTKFRHHTSLSAQKVLLAKAKGRKHWRWRNRTAKRRSDNAREQFLHMWQLKLQLLMCKAVASACLVAYREERVSTNSIVRRVLAKSALSHAPRWRCTMRLLLHLLPFQAHASPRPRTLRSLMCLRDSDGQLVWTSHNNNNSGYCCVYY